MGAVCSRGDEEAPQEFPGVSRTTGGGSGNHAAGSTVPPVSSHDRVPAATPAAAATHATNPFQAASAVLANNKHRQQLQQQQQQQRGGETENLPSPRSDFAHERATTEGDAGDDFDPLGWLPYPRNSGDKHQRPPAGPDDVLSVSASSVVKQPTAGSGGPHVSSVSSASASPSPANGQLVGGAFFNPGQWESMTLAERRASTKAMMSKIKEDKQESQLVAKGWRRSGGERRQHMNSSQTSAGSSSVVSFASETA